MCSSSRSRSSFSVLRRSLVEVRALPHQWNGVSARKIKNANSRQRELTKFVRSCSELVIKSTKETFAGRCVFPAGAEFTGAFGSAQSTAVLLPVFSPAPASGAPRTVRVKALDPRARACAAADGRASCRGRRRSVPPAAAARGETARPRALGGQVPRPLRSARPPTAGHAARTARSLSRRLCSRHTFGRKTCRGAAHTWDRSPDVDGTRGRL